MNQQPEALVLASLFERCVIAFGETETSSRAIAAKELRRLHARVQELEAMLDAVGAGGVSAQRITQDKDHIEQPLEMVAVQEPFATSNELFCEMCGQKGVRRIDGEALPDRLYAAPQPQEVPEGWKLVPERPTQNMCDAAKYGVDARDAERWSEIGKSIERACGELPEDFEINIHLENGAGTASLLYPSGEECENFPHDDGFAGVVNAAIDAAIYGGRE